MGLLDEQLEEARRATASVGVTPGMVANSTPQEKLAESLLPVPKSPIEKIIERDGMGKTLGKMLIGGMTGMTPFLMPELIGGRARYKAELADCEQLEEQREQQRRQGYADVLMNPESSQTERAVAGIMAGGVGEYDQNPKVYSPGQIGYDGAGNVVARGGDPLPPAPTSVMQNARETARGYGIPMDSKAYADLIAAYAEPSGTRELADGTVVPFNTVDAVLENWRSGGYDTKSQQQGQGGQQGDLGVTPGGGVTPQGANDASSRKALNEVEAEDLKIADQKVAFYNDLEGVINNFGEWDPEANDGEGAFTATEATLDNYGSVQNHPAYPGSYEFFKGDEEKDALVYMDQLVDMLTVDERGKLKGQGQITEGETAMLKRAVTVLQNRNLSDEAVQRELAKLMRGIIERRKKFESLQERSKSLRGGGTPLGSNDIQQTIIDLDAQN